MCQQMCWVSLRSTQPTSQTQKSPRCAIQGGLLKFSGLTLEQGVCFVYDVFNSETKVLE